MCERDHDMIRYALKCEGDHAFESWFGSAEAFDRLLAAGHVSCPDCGTTAVGKALMAPSVTPSRRTAAPLAAPKDPREAALADLRRRIEEKLGIRGHDFATEARRIHAGEAPERSIYGEARLDEARRLIEDGVPVAPLPFLPKARAN
jgi:hypothetical protein